MRQDVVLVLDDRSVLSNKEFWKALRLFAYSLREYMYASTYQQIDVYTVDLNQTQDLPLNGMNLELFAVTENLFEGVPAASKYFSRSSASLADEKPPLVFFFSSDKISNVQAIENLSIYSKYGMSSRYVVCSTANAAAEVSGGNIVSSSKNALDWATLPLFSKGTGIKANFSTGVKKPLSKKAKIAIFASVASICLVSIAVPLGVILGRTVKIVEENKIQEQIKPEYCIVSCRDGDRLIFRTNPEKDSAEILRLYDDEVLVLVEKGDTYDKVEYHGLSGYVSNTYTTKVLDSDSVEYSITNPEAMFEYAKALVALNLEIDGKDGWKWMEDAAGKNHLGAMWELVKKLEDDGKEAGDDWSYNQVLSWLSKMETVEDSAEMRTVSKLNEMVENGNYPNDAKENMKVVSEQKVKSAKLLRSRAAKKLSEYYFDSSIELASDHYKYVRDIGGIELDPEYMYKLAWETPLNDEDSIEWLALAGSMGHGDSYAALGIFLSNNFECDKETEISYYLKALSAGCTEYYDYCCYYVALYYWNDLSDYYTAIRYFKNVIAEYDYDYYFYNACYAYGIALEKGWGGVTKNLQSALEYYELAKDYGISGANDAYDRVYKSLYGNDDDWFWWW